MARAGEIQKRESDRRRVGVAVDAFEERLTAPGSVLKRLDAGSSFRLVGREHPACRPGFATEISSGHGLRERDGILQSHARAGADGEVGRVSGVAEECDVLVSPRVGGHPPEVPPPVGLRQQVVTVEGVSEDAFQVVDVLGLAHVGDARPLEGVGFAADDERSRRAGVGAGVPEAVVSVDVDVTQRLERAFGAEPGEVVTALADVRAERLRERLPRRTVDAVGADHQIGLGGHVRGLSDRRLEAEIHAHLATAVVEDLQQRRSHEAGVRVAAAANALSPVVGVDRIPGGSSLDQPRRGRLVGVAQNGGAFLREDDPPAVRLVGRVALAHRHVPHCGVDRGISFRVDTSVPFSGGTAAAT